MSMDAVVRCIEDGVIYRWRVQTLWKAAQEFEPTIVSIEKFQHELDEDRWYQSYQKPTIRSMMQHFKRVQRADLSYPIITSPKGFILDGIHRLVKAILTNQETILVVQLTYYPTSDYDNDHFK